MACGCSGKWGVAYQATFADSSTQTYATASEAQAAVVAAGAGATFKAVAK